MALLIALEKAPHTSLKNATDDASRIISGTVNIQMTIKSSHSHSMVAGGLELMS